MGRRRRRRSRAQTSGFKQTRVPFDTGYVKHRRGGSRLHKHTRSGRIHVDEHDPSRDPWGHVRYDVFRVRRPRRRRVRVRRR